MDEAGEMEPVLVRMLLPDPLGGLEGVHDVGEVGVRVGLVNEVVEHAQRLHDRALHVVELEPLGVLQREKKYVERFRD